MPNTPQTLFISHDAVGSEEVRRHVRSRAAQHSHRNGGRKPKTSKQATSQKKKNKKKKIHGNSTAPDEPTISVVSPSSPLDQGTCDDEGDNDDEEDSPERGLSTAPTSRRQSVALQSQLQLGYSEYDCDGPVASSSTTPSIVQQPSPAITVSAYFPVPALPWYPRLLEYMWPWMTRSWQVLDTTLEERTQALEWVQRLTFSDPCYFYMNLVSVARDLRDRGDLDAQYVIWLTGQVVTAINQVLQRGQASYNTGLILTVGRIALAEIIRGDRTIGANVHRPAQIRLLALAGGLHNLGLPSLVFKHVLWGDRLMAAVTGVSMSDVSEVALPRHFVAQSTRALTEDVRVLSSYAPQRKPNDAAL